MNATTRLAHEPHTVLVPAGMHWAASLCRRQVDQVSSSNQQSLMTCVQMFVTCSARWNRLPQGRACCSACADGWQPAPTAAAAAFE